MGYRGMSHMGNRGPMGYGVQGVWAHMGNGVQGYEPQWKGAHGQVIKKMSSCQKDVKCQKMKHLDYGGGSQKN